MKRQLRASGLNDYVAVDLVNDAGQIIENVFYFEKNKPVKILMKDLEDGKWINYNVNFDGEKLIMVDIDPKSDWQGTDYEIKPEDYEFELCDKRNSKPLI